MKLSDYAQWKPAIAIEDMDTTRQPAIIQRKARKVRDFWLLAVILLASVVSISTTIYYYNKNETLLYGDAYSHLIIARRVIDDITPGLDQFGGTWLPLQHILMLPFIWNDYLWRTGLAGTIPSMISYVIAAGYLFCTLRRLTKQTATSLIGVIIFLCNPNILYLQTTPLTEVMCTAAFAATAYYLLCWLQEEKSQYLACTAIATCIATLIRYDGWALFLVVTILVVATGVFRKHNRDMIIDQIMVYLSIAPLGIIFWFIWDIKNFGDPLYFQHGQYSSQAHQLDFIRRGAIPTYHNIWVSFRVNTIDVGQTIGWGLFVCALLSLVVILIFYRKRQEYFILAMILTPFVFYVASLYLGQSIIYLPGAGSQTFFNVRYGAQMVLPAAFLIARVISPLYYWLRRWYAKIPLILVCLVCIEAQVTSVNASGVISVQDGLTGLSCINVTKPIILNLAQHYNGGKILVYEETSGLNYPQFFGSHFSNIIWEGSGSYWKNALAHPEKYVDWVVLNPHNPNDTVSKLFTKNKLEFLSLFKVMSSDSDGLQLYYRTRALPLPTRPISNDLLSRPNTCKNE